MEACSLLVNLRKGMQRSSEQPLVGEERYVTTLITVAKETTLGLLSIMPNRPVRDKWDYPRKMERHVPIKPRQPIGIALATFYNFRIP